MRNTGVAELVEFVPCSEEGEHAPWETVGSQERGQKEAVRGFGIWLRDSERAYDAVDGILSDSGEILRLGAPLNLIGKEDGL